MQSKPRAGDDIRSLNYRTAVQQGAVLVPAARSHHVGISHTTVYIFQASGLRRIRPGGSRAGVSVVRYHRRPGRLGAPLRRIIRCSAPLEVCGDARRCQTRLPRVHAPGSSADHSSAHRITSTSRAEISATQARAVLRLVTCTLRVSSALIQDMLLETLVINSRGLSICYPREK